MITVSMTFKIVAGKEARFEEVFKILHDVLNHTEGHSGSRLYRDVEEAQTYLVVSEWLDRNQFETFLSSKNFLEAVDWNREQVLAGRIQHRVF